MNKLIPITLLLLLTICGCTNTKPNYGKELEQLYNCEIRTIKVIDDVRFEFLKTNETIKKPDIWRKYKDRCVDFDENGTDIGSNGLCGTQYWHDDWSRNIRFKFTYGFDDLEQPKIRNHFFYSSCNYIVIYDCNIIIKGIQ